MPLPANNDPAVIAIDEEIAAAYDAYEANPTPETGNEITRLRERRRTAYIAAEERLRTAAAQLQADRNAVEIEREKGRRAGFDEGIRQGSKAECLRIRTIIEHPEAVGREAMAKALALQTGISVADAVNILRTTPKASVPVRPFLGQRASESPYGLVIDTTALDEAAKAHWNEVLAEGNQRGGTN